MTFKQVFNRLHRAYGPQHWWPAETPFEVMVGAVLTQNTAWSNVERAIANLQANHSLSPEAIVKAPPKRLAAWLQPSGYFNIKAKRLKNFCRWYVAQGGFEVLAQWDTHALRNGLLAVNGVGPETADDMLLYAFARPVFVIDAYTRRLFSRLGLVDGEEGYEHLRATFEAKLPADVSLFNEYHALIVQHAKVACKKRPTCAGCCLARTCPARTRD
jgi:endonuclease-3 related protein